MTFSIELLDNCVTDPDTGGQAREGIVRIGMFAESFLSLESFWGRSKYEQHWREAVQRIVDGAERSCLITSIADPTQSSLLFWWPMHRQGETVHLQTGILLFDQLSRPFDPENPFEAVRSRTVINEDGESLSEWNTSVADLHRFLDVRAGA